jgi:hypothetical protein
VYLAYDWGLAPSLAYSGRQGGPAFLQFFIIFIGRRKLEVASKEQKFLLIRQEFNQFAGLPLTKKKKKKKKKEEEEKKKKTKRRKKEKQKKEENNNNKKKKKKKKKKN